MKLTDSKSRIVGIHLGEGQINLIYQDRVPLSAKLAFIGEEGQTLGYYEKRGEWSEKTLGALQVLTECMEQDALAAVFVLASTQETVEKTEEPPQF